MRRQHARVKVGNAPPMEGAVQLPVEPHVIRLAALAAQLHTPASEIKAAFEQGDVEALRLGGRPLPPSPRTPGPR